MHALPWLIITLSSSAFAQQFVVPNPDKTDLSESWKGGDIMHITWKAGWHGLGDEPLIKDLWITSWSSNDYSQLLVSEVSLNTMGKLDWRVNVSNEDIARDPKFVIRLKPHEETPIYNPRTTEASSRGFLLMGGFDLLSSYSTSSSMAPLSSSTSTSTTSSTSSAASRATVVTVQPSRSDDYPSGVIKGAIAGGVLGVVAFLVMMLYFLVRWFKKMKESKRRAEEPTFGLGRHQHRHDLVEGFPAIELDGNNVLIELDDTRLKEHELSCEHAKIQPRDII